MQTLALLTDVHGTNSTLNATKRERKPRVCIQTLVFILVSIITFMQMWHKYYESKPLCIDLRPTSSKVAHTSHYFDSKEPEAR